LNALITGGASGLGLGCALRLGRLGFAVTIADVDAAAGRQALASLQACAPQARFEQVDLADPESIRALAARLLAFSAHA